MFALTVFVIAAVSAACSALTIDNAQALESRDVKCNFGAPINTTTITLDNGAEVQSWVCKLSAAEIAEQKQNEEDFKLGTYDTSGLSVPETTLTKRQYNACGVACETFCYWGAGGGPDPNHCSQLAQGWTSGTFYVEHGTIHWYSLQSCEVSVSNYHRGDLTYCWNDLRGVTNYIAWNCQATQNAHGGFCVMNNDFNIGSIAVNACCS